MRYYCNEFKKFLKKEHLLLYCKILKTTFETLNIYIYIEYNILFISSNMYDKYVLEKDNFINPNNIILNLLLSRNKYKIELGLNLLKNYEN